MKPTTKISLLTVVFLTTLTLGCAEMQSSGPSSGSGASGAATGAVDATNTGPNRVSQGTQGDSLAACLARIPSDASESQRMLATLTCERDAKNRSSIDAVPGN